MTDLTTFRKNRIELSEYEYSKDVFNRVLMSQFTVLEVEVLEEILYSSLKIPLSLLEQNLQLSSSTLLSMLEKLSTTELFKVSADHVIVDKDMRKYYEFQILKFEEDFKPGMDYLQALLRKVPIHVLPNWYSIPRNSNNIFESILEKYLETPQIFQRYLMELHLSDPIQKGIMNAVYHAPRYEVAALDLIKKFDLSQTEFEKHMLHLEFSFVCCSTYQKKGNEFIQIVTPFCEWQEYLCFIKETEPNSIIDEETIKREKTSEFAAIEELSAVLELAAETPLTKEAIPSVQKKCPSFQAKDFESYLHKLIRLHLGTLEAGKFSCTSEGTHFLKMSIQDKILHMYRHPSNTIDMPNLKEEFYQQRIIREAEKILYRVSQARWVYLEEFLKGIFIPLKESQAVTLIRQGRAWKYSLPQYSEDERTFFKAIIQNWFFKIGITSLGSKNGKECFCVTSFGRNLFSNE